MTGKYLDILNRLWSLALGLMLVALFVPLPDLLDKTLTLAAAALVLIFTSGIWWEERRERQADESSSTAITSRNLGMVRRLQNSWMLPPALALGLLSFGTLAPISDLWDKVFSWIAIAILLLYVSVPMWDSHRERQADQSSSSVTASSDQT